MTSAKDDVRLPFSVLDPVVGDVFSALWEPEMLGETGSALKILTSEVLTQVGQTVLSATVMTALMSAFAMADPYVHDTFTFILTWKANRFFLFVYFCISLPKCSPDEARLPH